MHGVRGVVLSNHGGRQLDYARSPLDTLLEINERNPALTRDQNFDIYIDGGQSVGQVAICTMIMA
jgi:L-lactate dehydrogenase (cytochrome)